MSTGVVPAQAESVRQNYITARLERLPWSAWHVKLRLIVGTATFFDSFDAVTLSFVLPVIIPLWHIAPKSIGLLIASSYGGQLLGAIFFGGYAEKAGRLRALICCIAIMGSMSLLCVFSWSYNSLFVLRFVQGLGLGGEVPIAATYINELAKAKGRGKFFVMYEMIFVIGQLGAATVSIWIIPHFGWQYMFLIGAAPALAIPLFLAALPESPRWLASHHRLDEAEAILKKIEKNVGKNGRVFLPPVDASRVQVAIQNSYRWRDLFEGIYRRRTLTLWAFWFCSYFVNYALIAWLPSLYSRVYHLPLQKSFLFSLITIASGVVGVFCCAMVIDRIGRKNWMTLAFTGCAVSLLLLWLSGAKTANMVLLFVSIGEAFLLTITSMLYLYSPEIYPTRMRAFGSSIGTVWLRLASIIGPYVMGVVVGSKYPLSVIFIIFAAIAFIGAGISALFGVETKSRILEEVSP